jgi:hypothetical protein
VRVTLRLAIAVGISAACAPPVDGPRERQRAIDREDGARLAAQLARLPGVAAAEVALHHAMRDPLAVAPPEPATLSVVIGIDERSDVAGIDERSDVAGIDERSDVAGIDERSDVAGIDERSDVAGIDDRAAPDAIRDAAMRLARAAVPELAGAPVIEIHRAAHRATLAKVGPFRVEASSRAALQAVLALGCVTIAGLAGALAVRARRHRRGNSAQ